MNKLELWFPLKPTKINQPFGVNYDYYNKTLGLNLAGHNGIDFFSTHGQVVRATHDGEITYAGVDNNEGYGVVLRTLEPKEYKGKEVYFKTIYWHLVKDIPVRVGQKIKVGDIIGYADNTGLSTGTHLHFGLKPQEKGEADWIWLNIEQSNGYLGAIDPMPYFNNFYAEDSVTVISTYEKIIKLLRDFLKGRNN